VADGDGNAVLNGHGDRLDVVPLVDRPAEVLAKQIEARRRDDDRVTGEVEERIREAERGSSVLPLNGGELLEDGAVTLDGGRARLEVLDDRLRGDDRPETGAERGVEVVAEAPVVGGGGAKQAEAR